MTTEVDIVEVGSKSEGSYVDWPAIIGGIILASAISILMLAFGSAIGLSFADFDARDGASPVFVAIAAASWLLWVQISSFMAGGYLTGRMRRRHNDASEEESDIRDGAHGLLVWAGALVVGAVLAISGIGALGTMIGSTAATVATAAGSAAPALDDMADPNAYFVDLLFRPAAAGGTAETTEPAATEPTAQVPANGTATPSATAPMSAAAPARDGEAVRGEAGRLFARAATTELDEADRTYLTQVVADQTGMSDEEAATRVDEVLASVETAKAEAAEAAETARKTGIIGAFLIAASFLVSAIGAYWAAQKGGNHRDKGTAFPGVFRRF